MDVESAANDKLCAVMETLGFMIDRAHCSITPLTGGVSADIWRVETVTGPVVVKQALQQLRVSEEWQVPVSRNQHEVDWLETVAAIAPTSVPHILAADSKAGLFVMDYLPAATYPVWKNELAAGDINGDFAV